MKKILRFLISRTFWLSLLIVVQLGVFAMILLNISRFSNYLYLAFVLLSLAIVIWLVAKDDNPSYKITWIILIMTLPVLGGVFYLKFGNKTLPRHYGERMAAHRRNPVIRRRCWPSIPASVCRPAMCAGSPAIRSTAVPRWNTSPSVRIFSGRCRRSCPVPKGLSSSNTSSLKRG